MLPNSRRANEIGRARNVTNSKIKFTGISNAFATGLLGLNGLSQLAYETANTLFADAVEQDKYKHR